MEDDAEDNEDESEDDEDDVIQQGISFNIKPNIIELASIDFGTLARAQKSLTKKTTTSTKRSNPSSSRLKSSKPLPPQPTSKPKSKSKNAPQEISSKRPVSRKHFLPTVSEAHKPRDPRFETLGNPISESSFRKAYTFIDDYQCDEIALLKTQIRQARDTSERERLEKALKSLQSRKDSRVAKGRAVEVLRERKREEMEKVKRGKQPFYLKKSEERKLVMEDKYSKLGKKKLEKVLEKKRKKKEGKELRRMPRQR
jgi:ribosomal RNA-processing protein 36